MNNKTNLKKINKILSSSLASSLALGMITPAVSASDIEASYEYNVSSEEASTLQEISEKIGTELVDRDNSVVNDKSDTSQNSQENSSNSESFTDLKNNETSTLSGTDSASEVLGSIEDTIETETTESSTEILTLMKILLKLK